MTPRTLRARAAARLAAAGVASADRDADLLLAHVPDLPLGRLPLLQNVPAEPAARFWALVDRRATRVPLQHLTGTAPFRELELSVGPGVFVPRPETELLAGWAIATAAAAGPEPAVVDLGTGSGAIAAAVAHELPGARVHAVELDPRAFQWASTNLDGTGVELRLGDLSEAFEDLRGAVDVVVSNPPYIPLDAWESVAVEARDHDPELALFAGPDGLAAIEAVRRRAEALLRPGGAVGVEHADVQGESVPRLFQTSGRWAQVRDHHDLAGRPRFTTAVLAR